MADLQKWFNLANGGERCVMQFTCCLVLSSFSVIYYSNGQDKKSQCSALFNLLLCLLCTYLPVAFNFDNEIYSLVVNAKCIAYLSEEKKSVSGLSPRVFEYMSQLSEMSRLL